MIYVWKQCDKEDDLCVKTVWWFMCENGVIKGVIYIIDGNTLLVSSDELLTVAMQTLLLGGEGK